MIGTSARYPGARRSSAGDVCRGVLLGVEAAFREIDGFSRHGLATRAARLEPSDRGVCDPATGQAEAVEVGLTRGDWAEEHHQRYFERQGRAVRRGVGPALESRSRPLAPDGRDEAG